MLVLAVYPLSVILWILLTYLCCSYVSFNFFPLWLIPWMNLCFTLEIFPSISQLPKWAKVEFLSCPLSMRYTASSTQRWPIGHSLDHSGFDALSMRGTLKVQELLTGYFCSQAGSSHNLDIMVSCLCFLLHWKAESSQGLCCLHWEEEYAEGSYSQSPISYSPLCLGHFTSLEGDWLAMKPASTWVPWFGFCHGI